MDKSCHIVFIFSNASMRIKPGQIPVFVLQRNGRWNNATIRNTNTGLVFQYMLLLFSWFDLDWGIGRYHLGYLPSRQTNQIFPSASDKSIGLWLYISLPVAVSLPWLYFILPLVHLCIKKRTSLTPYRDVGSKISTLSPWLYKPATEIP